MRALRLALTRRSVHGAIAVVLAGVVAVVGLLLRRDPYALAIFWSTMMLASFVGWGSVVNLWIAPGRWADWGLRAGWGMALFVVTGGFLIAMHMVVGWVMAVQVLLGVAALFAAHVLRGPRGPHVLSRRRLVVALGRSGTLALVALAYGLAMLMALAFVGQHWFNESDDPPLYLSLAEKLVQTGSLFEPFGARRVTTFGGHLYLEAAFVSVSSNYYMWAVDDGLGTILTVALLVGHVKRECPRSWQWAALGFTLLLFFSLESTRRNTASLLTGVAAVVTLYRTVRVPLGQEPERPAWPMESRRVIALAVLTCVPILLRTSNAPAVVAFVALVVASDYLLGTRRPWGAPPLKSLARSVAIFAAAFLVALAPWSVLLAQSCGTPFYPFGHSTITPGWTFLRHAQGVGEVAKGLFEDMGNGAPLAAVLPFFVAGLAPLKGRARNDLVALTLASLIGMLVLSWQMTAFNAEDRARYYYAYVVAAALVASASVGRSALRAALVAACLGMHLAVSHQALRDTLVWEVDRASKARGEQKERDDYVAVGADYRDVQSHVPRGATMVTAVRENDRFDFTRNRVWSLDVLGGMGPEPGWPTHKGPEALARYLTACGVQYIVWVNFDALGDFYNRAHLQGHLSKVGSYLQGESALQLDAEDAIDQLARIRRLVYRKHNMSVVDLTSEPDSTPQP